MEQDRKTEGIFEGKPRDSFLQHALALEYIKLGDDEAARKLFEELLERDPGILAVIIIWENCWSGKTILQEL